MNIATKAALIAANNDEPFIVVSMGDGGLMISTHRGNARQVKNMLDLLHDTIL